MVRSIGRSCGLTSLILMSSVAFAQTTSHSPTHDPTLNKAEDIASQPVRDVDASKTVIPPVLQSAATAPYATGGTATCGQITSSLAELNEALGPDLDTPKETKDNKAGKLAEAGGRAVVNSFLPFRGLVREVSGAASAERRLAAAVTAGYARRGFLRGLKVARKCKG